MEISRAGEVDSETLTGETAEKRKRTLVVAQLVQWSTKRGLTAFVRDAAAAQMTPRPVVGCR